MPVDVHRNIFTPPCRKRREHSVGIWISQSFFPSFHLLSITGWTCMLCIDSFMHLKLICFDLGPLSSLIIVKQTDSRCKLELMLNPLMPQSRRVWPSTHFNAIYFCFNGITLILAFGCFSHHSFCSSKSFCLETKTCFSYTSSSTGFVLRSSFFSFTRYAGTACTSLL